MAVLTNTMLQGTAAISDDDAGYIIKKSLRFKSASSSKLTRVATGGNTRTFTISWWQKKHTPNTLDNKNCGTFSAQTDNNNHFTIGLENSGQGNHNSKRNGNSELNVGTSTYMFRDTTAWMHYCVACNTPDKSSDGARFKIYINGKERFTSGTRFDQNDPTEWNKNGVTHTIGWSPLSNWGYPDITLADIYHIDGLALSPAAFGQWDDTNCWQPKTFALPTPNTNASSPTWSNMLTTGSAGWDGSGSANGSPTRAFTGSGAGSTTGQWAYTAANNMGESHAIVFTPTGGIEINQSLEIYCGRSATTESVVAYVDMGNGYGEKITGTSGKWITLFEGKGTLTKFKTWKTAGNGGENGLSGVRVDGVDLVDGKTDPAERSNPNDGRVYSNAANWDNTSISNSLSNLFNSDSIHDYIYGEEIIWDTSGYSDFSGLLEFNMDAGTGCTIEVNDNAITPLQGSVTSATGWWTFGYFTDINKIKVTQTGGTAPYFYGVKLNGHLLLDATNDHSFHLKFNDTSTNARLGRNSIGNVSVGDATGGLPIYNTTADSDGYDPGETKGSGYRTDSSAGTTNNTGLVLAIPGDSVASGTCDVHQQINTGSSNKAINANNGSVVVKTDQSRFYGSSLYFDDSDDYINFADHADWDIGTGDYCIEAWVRWESVANDETIIGCYAGNQAWQVFTGNGGAYPGWQIRQSDNNYKNIYSPTAVVTNKWYHLACTVEGTNIKLYVNGKLKGTTAFSGTVKDCDQVVQIGSRVGGTSNKFNGWINDLRIYKGTAKYTADFTPPTRNDFTVTNLGAKADAQPTKQFHTVLYNGGGGDSSILGLSFKPDLVMIKCRSSGKWPPIADVVTGAGKFLHPNSNEAQGTSNHIKSFDSNGFTVTDVDTGTSNESGLTYVAWCWKAGGTATSNSDGSITTSISVNPNNTLSIIKYTGTGSNATIGHGLNKAPKMFIIKSLSDADDWYVYHYEAGANKHLWWNKYDGVQTSTSIWQNDHPSDSVIKIGTDDGVNESGDDYICYAFAEQDGLCAIGKYTGNGSNSGPTVNLGFKPAWITTKNSESDGGAPTWLMVDSVRGTDKRLWNNFAGNNGDTESTQASYTFSDTGFTITDDGSHFNGNNKEYYYLSFAQDASSGIYGDENIDSHTDSPTNSGTDTGLGGQVTGNYCVLSSATKHGGMDSLQKGNLEAYRGSAGFRSVFGTMGMHTGKWYFECYLTAIGSNSDPNCAGVGVAASSITYRCNDYFNKDAKGYVYLAKNGETSNNDAIHNSGYTAWNNTSDVVGVAFDADAGKLFFAHNNTWQGSSNPVTGANAAYTGLTDVPYLPGVMLAEGGRAIVNFGQRPFKYTAPSGYKCLCSANLDDLFTGDNKNNPSKYFDIYNYIGDGESTRTIAGVYDFAADLIWSKARDHSNNWQVYDRIRGDNKRLNLDGDNPESTSGTYGFVEAGTADGAIDIIDGSDNSYNMNEEDENFITWAWDAGTAASGANNDGTVNVSSGNQWVNATAGFSITKYTGDNASGGCTVGHGLSVKPEFVMVKRLGDYQEWVVGHKDLSATKNLHIDQTEAENTPAGGYIDLPNSTNDVVKLVGDPGGNGNTNYSVDYIMYCWVSIPGFSSIGTYSGTNNAGTGSFVYTGFRPKFWLSKSGNTTGGWGLYDTVRDIDGNGTASKAYTLQPQTSAAEDDSSTDINIDILSNGIQPVTTWNPVNSHDGGSGYGKMVYIAFAEHPFKTSRAL